MCWSIGTTVINGVFHFDHCYPSLNNSKFRRWFVARANRECQPKSISIGQKCFRDIFNINFRLEYHNVFLLGVLLFRLGLWFKATSGKWDENFYYWQIYCAISIQMSNAQIVVKLSMIKVRWMLQLKKKNQSHTWTFWVNHCHPS